MNKLLLYVGGAVLLYFLLTNMFKNATKNIGSKLTAPFKTTQDELSDSEDAEIRDQIRVGETPTINQNQARQLARQIKNAVVGLGTDEGAIYRAFQEIGNRTDFLMVYREFGIVNNLDMIEYLYDDLSTSQIGKLQNILSIHGVSIAR